MFNTNNVDRFKDIIQLDGNGNEAFCFTPIELRLDFNSRFRYRLQECVSWTLRIAFAAWCSGHGIGVLFDLTQAKIASLPIPLCDLLERYQYFCDLSVSQVLAITLMFFANEACFRTAFKRRRRESAPMSANALRPWLIAATALLLLDTALVIAAVENHLLIGWIHTSHKLSFGVGAIYAISVIAFAYHRVESYFARFV